METEIKLYADFDGSKGCLVFQKIKHFESKEQIEHFIEMVMEQLEKIYEEKIYMRAKINIFNWEIEKNPKQSPA